MSPFPYPLFDAHLHIIDPRFPLVVNQGYLPPPFTCADYLQQMASHDLCGGAVISGSFQGMDQQYLVAALAELGPKYVGVTQLPPSVSDAEIVSLHDAGIRAIRFNLKRGGKGQLESLEALANRVFDLVGWHAEVYLDGEDLPTLAPLLASLPKAVIDHLGMSVDGLPTLLQLVETGVKVKASGFGRVSLNIASTLAQIDSIAPHALMFGSDLPGTRAPRLFHDADLQLILDTLGEESAKRIFSQNAQSLYRML